mmetsp:Transcript_34954/g.71807  ORF Transcript_34954/g.71807 Transcript_34954/m.71807 type:complete len:179 (+) Transcript_34954:68-604(+)
MVASACCWLTWATPRLCFIAIEAASSILWRPAITSRTCLFEKKRIRAAGGYVLPRDDENPARLDAVLAMSRAFGNFRFKDSSLEPGARKVSAIPDICEFDAAPGDVLVLASDGVLDVVSSPQVAALAVRGVQGNSDGGGGGAAVEAAADVVWAALQLDTKDNVTSSVIRLGAGEAPGD